MVLSKAIYRVAGTLFGAVAAIILTSLFSQDRTMLIAVFAVYMACLVAIATLLRDFRAYGCVLAGYTVALISIIYVDAPTAAFTAMLDRVAVILLAVLALAFVSAIFTTAESARSLQSKLRLATKDIVAMALATLDQRIPPDPSQCAAMGARLMPLRSEIGFATPELLDGWARAKAARSALLGLFEAISAIQAIGFGLRNMSAASSTVDDAMIVPVDPALRRLRLALAVGRALREASVDKDGLNQPKASLHYDRLSQFSSWQHGEPVTLARRNVMRRLSDLGNLSFAVRRSWRALDQARIAVDPAIDAKARQILPTLSPVEILDLSQIYLTAAAGLDRSKRLDLVHAAAALYGTAILTTSEMRLLRHLELLRYQL